MSLYLDCRCISVKGLCRTGGGADLSGVGDRVVEHNLQPTVGKVEVRVGELGYALP